MYASITMLSARVRVPWLILCTIRENMFRTRAWVWECLLHVEKTAEEEAWCIFATKRCVLRVWCSSWCLLCTCSYVLCVCMGVHIWGRASACALFVCVCEFVCARVRESVCAERECVHVCMRYQDPRTNDMRRSGVHQSVCATRECVYVRMHYQDPRTEETRRTGMHQSLLCPLHCVSLSHADMSGCYPRTETTCI